MKNGKVIFVLECNNARFYFMISFLILFGFLGEKIGGSNLQSHSRAQEYVIL